MHDNFEPKNLLEWFGLRGTFDYSKARRLGGLTGVIIVGALAALFVVAFAVFVELLQAVFQLGQYREDTDGDAVRNYGLLFVALVGAPFVVWRSFVAARQVDIAAESLFNEKITSAVRDLSARQQVTRSVEQEDHEVILSEIMDDISVRVAAIDQLEGLVSERLSAAPRIDRALAAYVKANFPAVRLIALEPPFAKRIPRSDLQRAVDAIGRIHRIAVEVDRSEWRLDLMACDFDGVSFESGDFYAVNFSQSSFEGANFRKSRLHGCFFGGCLLNFAIFLDADLTGAKLNQVIATQDVDFLLEGASSVEGVTLIASNLSGIKYLGEAETIKNTFGTADTVLHEDLEDVRPSKAYLRTFLYSNRKDHKELSKEKAAIVQDVLSSGFSNWSPFQSNDLSVNFDLKKFYQRLGLARWPYL